MLVFNSEQLRMCIEEVEIVISVNARAFIPFFCQVGICYWNVSIIFYSHVVVVRVQYTEIRTTHTHNHFFFSIKYFKSSRCWSLLLSSGGGGWLLFETSQNKMETVESLFLIFKSRINIEPRRRVIYNSLSLSLSRKSQHQARSTRAISVVLQSWYAPLVRVSIQWVQQLQTSLTDAQFWTLQYYLRQILWWAQQTTYDGSFEL